MDDYPRLIYVHDIKFSVGTVVWTSWDFTK